MENPYKSPAPNVGDERGIGTLLLRIFAIGCWLASLLPVFGFLLVVNRPELVEKRAQNPPLFLGVCVVMFVLPPLGLALLGIASWWRARWIAVLGLAAFLPIVLWTLAARFWPR